jgi:hypothetical protein
MFHIVSKPGFHALSNGALVTALSLILCTRKCFKTIHGNCASIQLPFSAVRTALTGKPSAPFERAGNSGIETIKLKFYIYSVLGHDFCL